MSKYLILNSDSDFPQDWRIPDEADEHDLNARLLAAMVSGEVVEVPVEVETNLGPARSSLLLHGAKISTAAIIEFPTPRAHTRLRSVTQIGSP